MQRYATTSRGHRIYVNDDDPRGERLIAAGGDLNPGSLLLWNIALGAADWDLVVDVGVNYGEMLVGAELPAGAELVGFEPNLALHGPLARTLDESGIALDLRPHAVADRPGTARFVVDSDWSGTSSLHDERHDGTDRWQYRDVEVTTLDDVVRGRRSFCAKIDVEGFEREVVAGAEEALATVSDWLLMLEVAHMSRAFLAHLAERFSVFLMDLRTRRLIRVPGGNAQLADELLDGGWLYRQDCLLSSPAVARTLEAAA